MKKRKKSAALQSKTLTLAEFCHPLHFLPSFFYIFSFTSDLFFLPEPKTRSLVETQSLLAASDPDPTTEPATRVNNRNQ